MTIQDELMKIITNNEMSKEEKIDKMVEIYRVNGNKTIEGVLLEKSNGEYEEILRLNLEKRVDVVHKPLRTVKFTTIPFKETNHPYYSSDMNYYSNDHHFAYNSWKEFKKEWTPETIDMDLNHVFRFDLQKQDEHSLKLELFYIHQRKGIYEYVRIENIDKRNIVEWFEINTYLLKCYNHIQLMWSEFSNAQIGIDLGKEDKHE